MEEIMKRFSDTKEICIVRPKVPLPPLTPPASPITPPLTPPATHVKIMTDLTYAEAQLKDNFERKKKGLKPMRLPHPLDEVLKWD
jgi:hypothetical protein